MPKAKLSGKPTRTQNTLIQTQGLGSKLYTHSVWDLALNVCIIFISWLGKMAQNSHSIARHFNAAMESIGRAVRPKSQSLWGLLRLDTLGCYNRFHVS
ncbi:hypothetical protein MNBD_GAMMA19-1350 [hydrothermal vent metagenome]|uniref:Uncharacterized protein n=1 Tax=hydrothermal vent metagenome TaxID=652676 RepID=A0A3B1ALN5_9ZZZZ